MRLVETTGRRSEGWNDCDIDEPFLLVFDMGAKYITELILVFFSLRTINVQLLISALLRSAFLEARIWCFYFRLEARNDLILPSLTATFSSRRDELIAQPTNRSKWWFFTHAIDCLNLLRSKLSGEQYFPHCWTSPSRPIMLNGTRWWIFWDQQTIQTSVTYGLRNALLMSSVRLLSIAVPDPLPDTTIDKGDVTLYLGSDRMTR